VFRILAKKARGVFRHPEAKKTEIGHLMGADNDMKEVDLGFSRF